MRRLRDDRDGLAEALDQLEGLTGIPFRQLEKDFWLTEALRGVAKSAADEGLPMPLKVVSERLGHSTPAFTMATYQHVLPGMQADAARTFANLLNRAA